MPAAKPDYAPILARIIFGIFPIALYFIVAGYVVLSGDELDHGFARKIFQRMTLLQIVTTDIFLVLMLSLPVKILPGCLFRIKYIWVTPWFSI